MWLRKSNTAETLPTLKYLKTQNDLYFFLKIHLNSIFLMEIYYAQTACHTNGPTTFFFGWEGGVKLSFVLKSIILFRFWNFLKTVFETVWEWFFYGFRAISWKRIKRYRLMSKVKSNIVQSSFGHRNISLFTQHVFSMWHKK